MGELRTAVILAAALNSLAYFTGDPDCLGINGHVCSELRFVVRGEGWRP